MIKEAYVSFEIAKLLKEKGFEQHKCQHSYNLKGLFEWSDNLDPYECSAPTHQMAMAWLRKRGIHINASISYDYSVDADGNEVDRWTFYMFEIYSSYSGNLIYTEEVNEYNSYEEAVEAALKYCLENLI